MYCPKCGAEVFDNDEFCSKCGEKIIIENISKTNTRKKKSKGKIIVATAITLPILLLVVASIIFTFVKIPSLQDKLQGYDAPSKTYGYGDPGDGDIGVLWTPVNGGPEIIIVDEGPDNGYVYCNNRRVFEYTIGDKNSLIVTYCDSEYGVTGDTYIYEYTKEYYRAGDSGTWYVDEGVLFIGSREYSCIR